MSEQDGLASILIVDDKPEKLLSLQVILEELNQRIVCAHSGREALRHLLTDEFAVILLDVNMPDMDGFEAASLIRQRPSLEHVPIIFITAYGDDMHMARGYSLGAVDYIHAPVIPDVLRSKVSVFVDLYQKNAQVRRQSESLRRRATQLQKLAASSIAINSAVAIEQMLQILAESAREIIGCQQSLAFTTADSPATARRVRSVAAFAPRYSKWQGRELHLQPLASSVVAQSPSATRLTDLEFRDHPDWEIFRSIQLPPIHGGLLAAPLTDRGGTNFGAVFLVDSLAKQFTGEDEALLLQLAQIASIAIQNAMFARERDANRLKDEFLATLSHELRTPLNAIVGWTQLLRMENLSEDASHGLDVIDRNVRAQTKLIEDLLDVSRITTGKMRLNLREIVFAPIVQAAIDAIRPAAETRGVSISADLAPDVRAYADPDRMQQVAWNLLSNAVKFTPPDGRVHVTLERASGQAQLRVLDTGQGIETDFLRFVFDRFRQADSATTRAHGGLGIGLNIVRHIVELHGGEVAVYSPGLGKGSTFTVTLPTVMPLAVEQVVAPAKEVPAAPAPRNGHPVNLSGKRVLVVDDEKDARDMVSELLRRSEANVVAAGSVREAFECLGKSMPDVLVSDLAMPVEDGFSLIQTLRQFPHDRGGQTPAIALTAYAREEDRLRALSAGFQMYLTKPLDPNQFLATVSYLASASDQEHMSLATEDSQGQNGQTEE